MKPVQRLVILVPWSPSEDQLRDFGCEELRRSGYDVAVLDMSVLVGSRERLRPLLPGTARMADHNEFETLVAGSADGTVFIDQLVGLGQISAPMSRVFRILKRHNARIMVTAAQPVPIPAATRDPRVVRALRLARLRKALEPRAWARLAITKMIALARRARILYPLPELVFSTSSDTLELFRRRMAYPAECVIRVNSLDHWRYRAYLDEHSGITPPPESLAVFLDEGASVHPDFEITRREDLRLPHQEYGAELRRFFHEFEAQTGLDVVIALHPRSEYAEADFFGGRLAEKGVTIDLVARSSAVIMHATTAVNFAVLFDKPVMLVETAGMEHVGYTIGVASVAAALCLTPVQVFKPAALATLDWDPSSWSRDGFAGYRERYVYSPTVGEATVWETVSASLRAAESALTP